MPNLSHQASAEYWSSYKDPIIYRVITFMESVEDWTLDGDDTLEEAVNLLGEALDNLASVDLNQLNEAKRFVELAANIKTGRGLRLLQALDTAHPGSASKVLMYAEENSANGQGPASFFLKRNIVFERLRLLSRTFSKDRLTLVAQALEGEE
ncbi:MAG: type IVB secretion system protein IcmW [Gammaproteobacteria bacterium]|nr:type IVB secretion system protein IcmW [Gammaproteobacteria bacterium]MCH9716016.1 type IVB secretion system protein IcmW [Gammaproteobacteria bacterium]MCH9763577.1 type IVB secretion system protein IcmW [Gammaproteobacteria bacterium]